ncbi:MAG: Amidohydrolase [bacterium ADurb.Bin429]|nr:MAG: Amidohydrolase [bacterium ADurb.Bin429]
MSPIIDMHQHAPAPEELDARVQACHDAGIVTAVLLGQPESRMPGDNALTLAAARAYPSLFRAWYGVDMDVDGPEALDRARDAGFTGLKFIGPTRAYNDPAYFPLYECAATLGLPCLFHLGIVANTPGYQDCDSNLMRAIHLDHIARRLPELTLIGAHFGNPWCEEAAMACRWNPNLFFDLSGSLLKYRRPAFLNELLWWKAAGPYASPDRTDAWAKIVFGSDVASPAIADVINDYTIVIETLNLDDRLRRSIWHDTAARILGDS